MNPNSSSITKVEYQEIGSDRTELPMVITQKKINATNISLEVNHLMKLSKYQNQPNNSIVIITINQIVELIILNLYFFFE